MSNTLNETLFQAIDTIVSKRIEEVVFDETIQCTVVSRLTKDGNEYEVKNNSVIYKAIAKDGEEYDINDRVCVSILKNGKDRIILGKYTLEQEDALEYSDPFDKLVISKEWLPIEGQTNPEISLSPSSASSESQTIKITEENRLAITLEGYDFMGIEFGVDVLGLNPRATGRWAIEIALLNSKNNSLFKFEPQDYNINNMELISPYLLSSTEIYGNPYSLTANFPQRKLFHFPKGLQLPEIAAIQINLYWSGDYTLAGEEANAIGKLILKNLKICFGFDANKYIESPIHLYVEGDYNNAFGYTDNEYVGPPDQNGKKKHKPAIKALLIDQTNKKIIKELPEHQSIRWYQHKIGLPKEKEDSYGGGYWEYIEKAGESSISLDPQYYTLNLDRPNTQIKAVLCENKPTISLDVENTQTLIFDDRRGEDGWWNDENHKVSPEDEGQAIIYGTDGNLKISYIPFKGDNNGNRLYDEDFSWDVTDLEWLQKIYPSDTIKDTVVAIINLQKNIFLQEIDIENYKPIKYYQYAGDKSEIWTLIDIDEVTKTALGTSKPFVFENTTIEDKNADETIQIDVTIGNKTNNKSWPIYDNGWLLDKNIKFCTLEVKPVKGTDWKTIKPEKITWSIVRGGLLTGLTTDTSKALTTSPVVIENINEDNIDENAKIFVGLEEKFEATQAIAACNIVKCTVYAIGNTYTTTINFPFSELSNQGTNYSFRIEPISSKYLLNEKDATQTFQAFLETSDGIALNPADYQLSWEWKQNSSYHVYSGLSEYPVNEDDRCLLKSTSTSDYLDLQKTAFEKEQTDAESIMPEGDFDNMYDLSSWQIHGEVQLVGINDNQHKQALCLPTSSSGCSRTCTVKPNSVYTINFDHYIPEESSNLVINVSLIGTNIQELAVERTYRLTQKNNWQSSFFTFSTKEFSTIDISFSIIDGGPCYIDNIKINKQMDYYIWDGDFNIPTGVRWSDFKQARKNGWMFTSSLSTKADNCLFFANSYLKIYLHESMVLENEKNRESHYSGVITTLTNLTPTKDLYVISCNARCQGGANTNMGIRYNGKRHKSFDVSEEPTWSHYNHEINESSISNGTLKLGFIIDQKGLGQPIDDSRMDLDQVELLNLAYVNESQCNWKSSNLTSLIDEGSISTQLQLKVPSVIEFIFDDNISHYIGLPESVSLKSLDKITFNYDNKVILCQYYDSFDNLLGENWLACPFTRDEKRLETIAIYPQTIETEELAYQYYTTTDIKFLNGALVSPIPASWRSSYPLYQEYSEAEEKANLICKEYNDAQNNLLCDVQLDSPFSSSNFVWNKKLPIETHKDGEAITPYYLFSTPRKKYYNEQLGIADMVNFSEQNVLYQWVGPMLPTVGLSNAIEGCRNYADDEDIVWYDEDNKIYTWIEILYFNLDDAELAYGYTWSCPEERIYNMNILQAKCTVNALYATTDSTTTSPVTLTAEYPIIVLNVPENKKETYVDSIVNTGPTSLVWADFDILQNELNDKIGVQENYIELIEPFSIKVNGQEEDSTWEIAAYDNEHRYKIANNNYLQISEDTNHKVGFENTKTPISFTGFLNNEERTIFIQQPLELKLKLYTSGLTNEWAGGQVTFDEENATIMATALGAGIKNTTTNTFSGILMGNFKVNNEVISGLVGQYENKNTFLLRASDGTGIFTGQLNATGGTIANWQIGEFTDQATTYTGALFSDAGRYRLFLRADFKNVTDVAIGIKQYNNLEYTASHNKDEGKYIFYVSHNGSLRASNMSILVNTYDYDLTRNVDNKIQSLSYTLNMGVCAPWFGVGHHSGATGYEGLKNSVGWLLTERREWQTAGANNSSPQLFIGTTFPINSTYAANKYKHSIVSRYGYSFDIAALIGIRDNTANEETKIDQPKPAELRLIARNAYDLDHGSIVSGLGPSIIEFKSDAFRFTGNNNDGISDTDNIKLIFTGEDQGYVVKWEKVTT